MSSRLTAHSSQLVAYSLKLAASLPSPSLLLPLRGGALPCTGMRFKLSCELLASSCELGVFQSNPPKRALDSNIIYVGDRFNDFVSLLERRTSKPARGLSFGSE